jgi:phosphoadenosine phosphosulfate reductase
VTPAAIAASDIATLDAAFAAADDLVARIAFLRGAIAHRGTVGRIVLATSLGMEDQAILHAIAADLASTDGGSASPIEVVTLDTGRHFPETLDTIAASVARYRIPIRVVAPEADDVEALVVRDGIDGFRASVDNRKACCHVRKVKPLQRALAGAGAWITGLRRGQSSGRADVAFAEVDPVNGLVKLNPLADWSLERLEAYVAANDIPVNALHARGFPSIGCAPCTRAVRPGEEIRAGRWWWEAEAAAKLSLDGQECGLHSPRRPNPVGPSTPASAPRPASPAPVSLP